MNAQNKYAVRCYAGDGSIMGSILENDFGRPLTKREANRLCDFENERSRKRREQNLPYAFDYAVYGWNALTLKPV